jgi:molybdopterin converting factor small subunit
MARVVFLGRLGDGAGPLERSLETPTTIELYLASLKSTEPDLHAALTQKGIRRSLNLILLPVNQDGDLRAGDELAFMPPYTKADYP